MAINMIMRRPGRVRLCTLAVAVGVLAAGTATAKPAAADTTGLVTPVVTSTVFPPDTSPGPFPLIRTPGTFTFSEPASSGVVAYAYVLNQSMGVPALSNPHVAADADGTATTPPLRSAQWGSNTLTVVAVDAAGQETQPVNYSFYLLPEANPDAYSDYDGDGNIDLMSTTADGAVGFSAGHGDGTVAAPVDSTSGLLHSGALIAGGGNENRSFFQNLFVFEDFQQYGYEVRNLTAYLGDGLGGFAPNRSVVVPPPRGMSEWPALTQLIAPGDITGHNRADLIGKVGDQLLLFPSFALYRYNAPVPIAGAGWSGRTVVGVVDVTGDGIKDLVARDDASGDVWLYPGTAGGTFGDESTRVLIGTGLKAKNYPLVVAKGDVTGDALPDIWAVRANGHLAVLPGQPGGGFADPVNVDNSGTWAGVTTLG